MFRHGAGVGVDVSLPPATTPLVVVVDLVTSVGGVQRVMSTLLPRLQDAFNVVVLDPYANPAYAELLGRAGIAIGSLGVPPPQRFIGGRGRVDRVWRLARHAPWLVWTGALLRSWVRAHRPAIVYFNQLPPALFFSRFIAGLGPALLYHAHGFASVADIRQPRRLSRFARVLAVSRATRSQLIEAGLAPARALLVYNGVDTAEVQQRANRLESPLPDRAAPRLVLAHVATLAFHKRQDLSIRALAELPEHVHLWLCGSVAEGGDPAYEAELRRLAIRLGVADRVVFLGWRNDAAAVISAADLVVLPSGTPSESFGMVLAEAMALAKPCVGAATGGVVEVIEHGETGLLVEPGNLSALVAALSKLVRSAELRQYMGRAGRQRVETLFDANLQSRKVKDVLLELVSSRGV